LNRLDPEHKVDEVLFEVGDVWSCDIVVSSGEGKPKESGNDRTTIFKRTTNKYQLKMQSSRGVFSDIVNRFPTFPFNIRELDVKTRQMAIKECVSHSLLVPYPILQEKEGEFVVETKFTAIVTATGAEKIAGLALSLDSVVSEKKLANEDVLKLLTLPINEKKKKKKSAKKNTDSTTAATEAPAADE
jgi:hypothetical protein